MSADEQLGPGHRRRMALWPGTAQPGRDGSGRRVGAPRPMHSLLLNTKEM